MITQTMTRQQVNGAAPAGRNNGWNICSYAAKCAGAKNPDRFNEVCSRAYSAADELCDGSYFPVTQQEQGRGKR